MNYITLDPYYSEEFFNECKEALKNNNIPFDVLIYIKSPFDWYFSLEELPIMVNYDTASESITRWLVNIVRPLRPSDEYLLLRRNNDKGPKALEKFVNNEPLRIAQGSDYACFFNVKNREEVTNISKEYPGKIWYFGKYYNNKFRVCLATHEAIKTFIDPSQILVEKTKEDVNMGKPGAMEAFLNWKVFRENDRLVKFTETPYFEDGNYKKVKIMGEISSKYLI